MLNWKEVLDWKFEDVQQSYTRRDAILYALGLGYGHDPMDEAGLRYLYEAHEQGQLVVPSLSVVMGGPGAWMRDARTGIEWVKSLHGEQGLVMHAPLPPEATVIGRNRVTGIIDKGAGKGSLLLMERDIVDAATGQLLATRTSSSFLRGDGGCGAPAREQHRPEPMPTRAPDLVHRIETRPETALIYRLSGDYNPVHASPAIARKAGFDRPILHGLCTFGLALPRTAVHRLRQRPCQAENDERPLQRTGLPGRNADHRHLAGSRWPGALPHPHRGARHHGL